MDKDVLKMLKRAKDDPLFFIRNVVGVNTTWEKQHDIMQSVHDNQNTSVRSCHGAGKSFISAMTVAWFLTTHPYSLVITTAPTGRQVREILWQEIAKLHSRSKFPLGGQLLTTKWAIDGGWFALGFSSDEGDKFQGYHAKDMLLVVDEACGVAPIIFEAGDSLLTAGVGNKRLYIGNPTEPSGPFFDSFKSPNFYNIHIDAFDTPNLKAGSIVNPFLVTKDWVDDRRLEWGENSPAWLSRVRGCFPETATDSFIQLIDVDRALDNDLYPHIRKLKETPGSCILAVDPARFGDDESIIMVRRGSKITRWEKFTGLDGVQLGREVLRVMFDETPELLVVDTNGVGSSCFDYLFREAGVRNIVGINSQERANDEANFINKRVEMWAVFRSRLSRARNANGKDISVDRDIDLTIFDTPRDREIIRGQFIGPKYKFDARGRYQLESKEDMKKRGLKSPDRADAIVMAFYFDGHAGVGLAEFLDEKPKKAPPGTVAEALEKLGHGDVKENWDEAEDADWLKLEVLP
jgi:hypothetical protein